MPLQTNSDILAELQSDSPLNKARAQFSHGSARIEQAGQQRTALSPIEMRRMEFVATQKILEAYGTTRPRDVTLAENLAALEAARSELDSIHSQYGDKANAREHSLALRLLDKAISDTKYALGV